MRKTIMDDVRAANMRMALYATSLDYYNFLLQIYDMNWIRAVILSLREWGNYRRYFVIFTVSLQWYNYSYNWK